GMWVKGEVMSRVGDTLRGALRPYSSVTSAFMEAIYGRVRDYALVWAVLRPLMRNIEYDPEPSVLLWENAINYDLSEDGECVYCDLNPKFGGA
ncbi:MAG: hypothetical protein KC492_29970, partial [Myxococcales bacterium]|nr:hypothetical protein [Myxococcales bacterium]